MMAAEHNSARSVFKRGIDWAIQSHHMCNYRLSVLECSMTCPGSSEDAVGMQMTQLTQKVCAASVSEEERQKFLQSTQELFEKVSERATSCEKLEREDEEAFCKHIASCLLGSALDEFKGDYPADVVTFVADSIKQMLTPGLKDSKPLPEACSILYEPYKAERRQKIN